MNNEAPQFFSVSRKLFGYLDAKTGSIKRIEYNGVALVADKRQWVKEYITLVPPELDCILAGSAIYDTANKLIYFELDRSRIGKHKFFKVKGFSHLISTFKLNRIDFALECIGLENYFDYAAKRNEDYQARLAGTKLAKARKAFERAVEAEGDRSYKYVLDDFCDAYQLRRAGAVGFTAVFDSFIGDRLPDHAGSGRFLCFEFSWQEGTLGLAEPWRSGFQQYQFELPNVKAVSTHLTQLPEKLQKPGRKLFWETLLSVVLIESKAFDQYELIHHNRRWRLFLSEANVRCANPLLMYCLPKRNSKTVI